MNKTLDLIFNTLKDNGVVLLHCKGGRHRAGVVAGTTLAILLDISWKRGMSLVISKRSSVYSDKDKSIVDGIADALELHEFVTEYCHTDGWSKVSKFFRDDDTEVGVGNFTGVCLLPAFC